MTSTYDPWAGCDIPPPDDRDAPPDVPPGNGHGGAEVYPEPSPPTGEPPYPEPMGAEAYHGISGDFVDLMLPHTEADPAALLIQFLAAAGSAVGAGPYIQVGGDRHYPRLFLVIVGDTAKGRKGSSWSPTRAVLSAADPEWAERVASGLSSGEGLIWQVRDPVEKWQTPTKNKANPYPEPELVIVDPGEDDKRLLVVEGEFGRVLRVAQREGSTLTAVVRSAWDLPATETLQSLTKNSPAKATGAHICIIGHITSEELRRLLTATETANGFANRFLWLAVRRSKLLPDGGNMDDRDVADLGAELRGIMDAACRVERMTRSPDAAAMWREVYPHLSRDDIGGLLGAILARSEAQVLRVSMLYALLDGSAVVQPEHLAAALEVWRYCEDSAAYIYGDATGDPVADEILTALRTAGPEGMARTELRDHFSRNVPSGRMGAALAALRKSGRASMTMEPTQGRPREVWRATARRGA